MILGIAHGHGGFVTIDSTPGQGTTVGLAIPESHELPSNPLEPVKPAPRSHPAAKVLVVDDGPEHILEQQLRAEHPDLEVLPEAALPSDFSSMGAPFSTRKKVC